MTHPMPTDTPREPLFAIEEGEMEIAGFKVRTAVLNNGQRVVMAEDAEALLRWMMDPASGRDSAPKGLAPASSPSRTK